MLPHRSQEPPAVPTAPTEVLTAPAAEVAVVDGGTLRLRDRVVRLQGVQPPPRGASCVTGGQECGAAAANALAALVWELPVACRLTGADSQGRDYATCQARGTDLNRSVVAAGWARADARVQALKAIEDTARAERRGVWASAYGASW